MPQDFSDFFLTMKTSVQSQKQVKTSLKTNANEKMYLGPAAAKSAKFETLTQISGQMDSKPASRRRAKPEPRKRPRVA